MVDLFFIKGNIDRGKSKRCQAESSLNLSIPNKDNCQKIMNGLVLGRYEFPVQCSPYITDNRYPQCSRLCDVFASCINGNQNQKWWKRCSRAFNTPTQRFLLSTEENSTSSSLTKIHITRCQPVRKCLFIINVDKCRCSPVNNDHGTYMLQGKVFIMSE